MTIKEIAAEKPIVVNTRSDGKTRFVLAIGNLGNCGLHSSYLVYGDCLEDAIDYLVDIKGDTFPGFFNHDEEVEKAYWDESHEDHAYAQDNYFPAGNASELFTNEIVVLLEQRKGRHY